MSSSEGLASYAEAGVNYSILDLVKVAAQKEAASTDKNLAINGVRAVAGIRGESAFVWEEENRFGAKVLECLGTKNKVADSFRKISGRSHYDTIAQDVIAAAVNDIIAVGAKPYFLSAYWAVGRSEWFDDWERSEDLIKGWARACNMAQVTWAGGETPSQKDNVEWDSIDLAASVIGYIEPKSRKCNGEKIEPGDAIVLAESSGLHTNGYTLYRSEVGKTLKGYSAKLSDGSLLGEALLKPSHIYSPLVADLFDENIDIHYMQHLTGHGWPKLSRANRDLRYVITQTPEPQPVYEYFQQITKYDDKTMYEIFNMGAGYAYFLREDDVEKAIKIGREKHNLKLWKAGYVEEGPKEVYLQQKDIILKSLNIR